MPPQSFASVEAVFTTSSTVNGGISWTRSGTILTISHPSHGRSSGDFAIVRNANVDQLPGVITVVDANTFTLVTPNSGATSGADGAYSLGVTYTMTGALGSLTAIQIIAPANADVQIQSFRMHLPSGSRATTTFTMTVPNGTTLGGAFIGAGGDSTNTAPSDIFVPLATVRSDADATTAVAFTLSKNNAGGSGGANPASFVFGNLGLVANGVILVVQF
jgi:hypothetical protein